MAVNDWYARQFGERDHIAITFSLSPDPYPCGDPARDATWGGFSLWVRGRCLTSSVSNDGSFSEDVRWNLLEILEWLSTAGVRLVNEEPQPLVRSTGERDACDWLNDTEEPPATFSGEQEAGWFNSRSDWRRHHAIRSAAIDVALPNVVLRRLGDFVEVSWDNETWGVSRTGLRFVERRGTDLISAARAATVISEAVRDCTVTLTNKFQVPRLQHLADAASTIQASGGDWRWLIHDVTAQVIRHEMVELRETLTRRVEDGRRGMYVPHSNETLVLRQARLTSSDEIKALLTAALAHTESPADLVINNSSLRGAAPVVRPYIAGYDAALQVRAALGWADAPTPNLDEWMTDHGIALTRHKITPSVDLLTSRIDNAARVSINPAPSSPLRRETAAATAIGHLLMDYEPVSVDGLWEHWPTSARARAFGIMLLLPQEGLRRALAGREHLDASDVADVMNIFGTGPYATTHHLRNLRFIESDQRRDEILRDLVTPA